MPGFPARSPGTIDKTVEAHTCLRQPTVIPDDTDPYTKIYFLIVKSYAYHDNGRRADSHYSVGQTSRSLALRRSARLPRRHLHCDEHILTRSAQRDGIFLHGQLLQPWSTAAPSHTSFRDRPDTPLARTGRCILGGQPSSEMHRIYTHLPVGNHSDNPDSPAPDATLANLGSRSGDLYLRHSRNITDMLLHVTPDFRETSVQKGR